MSSIPDPATTDWVPLFDLGRQPIKYLGDYSATTTYNDGDCVIGPDGLSYVCVMDNTLNVAPSWSGQNPPGIPLPVVNGQWIKGVGGAAVWQPITLGDVTVARVKAARATVLTLLNSAWMDLTWDQSEFDTDNMHSVSVNTNRLTANTPGTYAFHLYTAISIQNYPATGFVALSVGRNNSAGAQQGNGYESYHPIMGGIGLGYEVSGVFSMNAGDYAFGQIYQQGSGTCQMSSGAFSMWRIG
jgi:hypothetical protein